MSDARPPLAAALTAFGGFGVTITRPFPDHDAVVTSGFWLQHLDEAQAFGHALKRLDPRRVLVVPLPASGLRWPPGSIVDAPEVYGGPVKKWRVEGYEQTVEVDALRLIVVEVES